MRDRLLMFAAGAVFAALFAAAFVPRSVAQDRPTHRTEIEGPAWWVFSAPREQGDAGMLLLNTRTGETYALVRDTNVPTTGVYWHEIMRKGQR